MIAYFAADLLWASKIKATADAIGVPARPVRNLDMLEARLSDSDVRGLIVDLDAAPTAFELVRRVRAVNGARAAQHASELPGNAAGTATVQRVRIAAFGPHVETESLRQAHEEGCDLVLTRGAMDRSLERVLRELDA